VAWFHSDEQIGCVKGRCYGTNPTDSALSLHATVERHIAEKANIFAREVIDGFTFFGGGQAFFRADALEQLGTFDEEVLVEDIDMSSRIHEAGLDLRVDPKIVTYEEHPATLDAWWNQRKRWARGWMQVAVRYLPRLNRQSRLSQRERIDAAFTFVAAVLPAIFIFNLPITGLDILASVETATYIPNAEVLWMLFGAVPIVAAYLVFLQDWRDGHDHHWLEYLAAFTLGPYFMLQTIVYVVAFVDEFILDRPSIYVTTARSEAAET
jgi:cellulose synthase/poly-beta-1,6-N-acetylglucosamine synthase-like glycosyltransferase